MGIRVNALVPDGLKIFGLLDNEKCFNCGTCSASCSLTEKNLVFPRRDIRNAQLGLSSNLTQRVEPWLCYYCGDCSKRCPREANPAEQMMALRRYLTTVYDWTGLSLRFYQSKIWEIGAVAFVALIVSAIFIVAHALNPGHILTDLAIAPDGHKYVALNTFAPHKWVHLGDMTMGGILTFFLITNVINMYFKIVAADKSVKVPFGTFVKNLWLLPYHFVTQMRLLKCGGQKGFWLTHIFLMSGYIMMFVLIMVFLPYFQLDVEGVNITTYLGYYATFALTFACFTFALGRIRKKREVHKYSHFSDWLFLALLLLTVITGILVHILRYYLELPTATYAMYVIHLAVSVPMLMVEVPFSKWSHLIYRPVAMYLSQVKEEAKGLRPIVAMRGEIQ